MPIEQRFILLNFFLFFSIVINILTPSKLGNDFIRPITFQSGTIPNVWRVNRHVQVIKNFEGSVLHIIFTYTVWNTSDIWSFTSRILTIPPTLSLKCNHSFVQLAVYIFETDNSNSIFLNSLRSSLRSLLILHKVLSNFAWYSKSMRSLHLLFSFLKATSESAIFISKTSLTLLTAKFLSIDKITSAHLGSSANMFFFLYLLLLNGMT